MPELDTKKVEAALDITNHPDNTFSFTGKDGAKVAGETHYNFAGKPSSPHETYEGAKTSKSTVDYTVIVKEDTGAVFVMRTTTDINGKEMRSETNRTVGVFGSVANFDKALNTATVGNPSFGAAYNALHNVEAAKVSLQGMPTVRGETPVVETGSSR